MQQRELPENWDAKLPVFPVDPKGLATRDSSGKVLNAVLGWLLHTLQTCLPDNQVVAAGHRVVHGGRLFERPVVIDDAAMAALADLVPLAPAHQPHNLAAIRAVEAAWPGLPQAACFDTAFHFVQPRLARLFGLPHSLSEQGIVR
jgi:acetate kinase